VKLRDNLAFFKGAQQDLKTKLLSLKDRLIIPRQGTIRQTLFQLAHDTLGHFSFDKCYEILRRSYFWPQIQCDLNSSYIPSCSQCLHNKGTTLRPIGPLHLLLVPDHHFDSINIDFIGPLPVDKGFDMLMTITDQLGLADVRLVPCWTTNMTPEVA